MGFISEKFRKFAFMCASDEIETSESSGIGLKAALYLIPSTMSDGSPDAVIPPYNLTVIRGIRHFVVENVRTARRFLKRCDKSIDIDALEFVTLDEHTSPDDIEPMLKPLTEGNPVGVISEAGCPAVADPGADIVAAAQRRGLTVMPLVGPSSILLSLMGSGFNGQTFAFNGYLPYNDKERTVKFREMERRIIHERQTQIFIETPYRNSKLLTELIRHLPPSMLLCVASDITGPHQSIITRPLSWWKSHQDKVSKIPTIFLLFN